MSIGRAAPRSKARKPHKANPYLRTRGQLRVLWRRPGWSATTNTKARCYYRRADALRFMDRLHARGPVEWIRLEARICSFSPWREISR